MAGIDYTETSSPVIKGYSIRVIFAVGAVLRMHMKHFNIETFYLNSDLTTVIFMHQPEGFIIPKYPEHKQSGRLWNHIFDT